MQFSYKLPKSGRRNDSQYEEHFTETNSVVIIGANGSGKSRLGEWIERCDLENIHRIVAQRNITIDASIKLRSYEISTNQILHGQDGSEVLFDIKSSKPGSHPPFRHSTSYGRNDINYVFSAVFAQRTKQLEDHDERAKLEPNQTLQREPNIIDDIQEVWESVFPNCRIKFKDAKIHALFNGNEFNGIDMSDGERVALYLIAQALVIPDNIKVLIIDEPEIHLHHSIINRLWSAIEAKRKDSLFIYITHDTKFAASHHSSDKIWVKSYDGNDWEWELICDSELPEQLLIEILGNRNPILFVEGDANSLDTQLYEVLYPNHHIIPCGSCTEVIARTKAFNSTPQINHIKAFGLIDRDYRSEMEINNLKEDGIYSLKVAEVENLFITPELFSVISKNAGFNNDTKIKEAIDFIIDVKYANMKNQQIRAATIMECKYQLSILDISEATSDSTLLDKVSRISYEKIQDKIASKYDFALTDRNYKDILQLFNAKELSKSVGRFFGGNDKDYRALVIRLAHGNKQSDIRNALLNYLPSEIFN